MRKLMLFAATVSLLTNPVFAQQEHTSRFELTQDFVTKWSASPVRSADVKVLGAATQHQPADDCEIHVGAEFDDDSFSDFSGVVIEPPNVCKTPAPGTGGWKTVINKAAAGKKCTTTGFMRAWPEHLTNGVLPSNPNHFLEVHPALTLTCGTKAFDFTDKLEAFDDLGFKPAATVNKMMDMHLWVCRGCSDDPKMLSFDYCFGDPCTAGQASNFARMKATIMRSTIKLVDSKETDPEKEKDGVVSAIARIKPKGSTSGRVRPLKLYAVKGTQFYRDLLAERDKSGADPSFELIGIFTFDPFSVVRTMDNKKKAFEDETWTPVMHPVSLVVFGSF
jgi:hypothetical protein